MAIVEGYWICPSCGRRNRGSIIECQSCGKAADNTIKFQFDPNAEPVSEEVAESVRKRGENWSCTNCGSQNSNEVSSCQICGNSRDTSDPSYSQFTSEHLAEEARENSTYRNIRCSPDGSFDNQRISQPSSHYTPRFSSFSSDDQPRNFRNILKYVGVGLAAIAVIILLVLLLTPRVGNYSVLSTSWQREISIEELHTYSGSDWNLPIGARLIYTNEEFHHNKQVPDHTEKRTRPASSDTSSEDPDLGNGYFDTGDSKPETEEYEVIIYRNEPVYETKYYYEIDRWEYKRSVSTSANNQYPCWGVPILGSKEREGTRSEKYTIEAYNLEDKKTSTLQLSYDEWKSLKIDQTVRLSVSIGGFAKIETEKKK